MACIPSVSRPSASSTTARGFPANGVSVKTSSVTKRRGMASNLFGWKTIGWRYEFVLRRDGQDLTGASLLGALQQAVDRGRCLRKSHRRGPGSRVVDEKE